MSDSRNSEDRVEKLEQALIDNKVELKLFNSLFNIGLLKRETTIGVDGTARATEAWYRYSMLKTVVNLDLSGREWDDDYNPEDG